MSVTVHSDVGGHTITAVVNGARLVMDLETAYQLAHFVGVSLDKIYADQVAKHQQSALYKQMNGSH
jgi:hypothetical protein